MNSSDTQKPDKRWLDASINLNKTIQRPTGGLSAGLFASEDLSLKDKTLHQVVKDFEALLLKHWDIEKKEWKL